MGRERRGGVRGRRREATVTDGYGVPKYIFKTNKLFIPHCTSKQRGWKQGCGGVGEGEGTESGFFGPWLWSFIKKNKNIKVDLSV